MWTIGGSRENGRSHSRRSSAGNTKGAKPRIPISDFFLHAHVRRLSHDSIVLLVKIVSSRKLWSVQAFLDSSQRFLLVSWFREFADEAGGEDCAFGMFRRFVDRKFDGYCNRVINKLSRARKYLRKERSKERKFVFRKIWFWKFLWKKVLMV